MILVLFSEKVRVGLFHSVIIQFLIFYPDKIKLIFQNSFSNNSMFDISRNIDEISWYVLK